MVTFPFSVTLQTASLYLATATAETSDGTLYQDQFALNVLDPVQTEALLQQKWDAMQAELLAGNIDGALTYFVGGSQSRYRQLFTDLQASLPGIFASIETFHLLSVSNDRAEAEAVIPRAGTTYSYPIFYIQNENGIWKLRGF